MQHELNADLAAMVVARKQIDQDCQRKIDRFIRFSKKRAERLQRERENNTATMFRNVARSLGMQSMPDGAELFERPGGAVVLYLPDPPKKPEPPTTPVMTLGEAKKVAEVADRQAEITPMPVALGANGNDH